MTSKYHIAAITCSLLLVAPLFACSSSDSEQMPDQQLDGQPHTVTEQTDDGLIVEQHDTTGDGVPDIIRYYEEYEDPRQEGRMRRRIRKMEIDVTGDQTINVRRFYDEYGNVEREENDQNLDGRFDTILQFAGGELTRKLIRSADGDEIVEQRVYYDGELVRVERDTNLDGEVDRWEYYEDGVLMRVGLDTTRNGSADTWQLR